MKFYLGVGGYDANIPFINRLTIMKSFRECSSVSFNVSKITDLCVLITLYDFFMFFRYNKYPTISDSAGRNESQFLRRHHKSHFRHAPRYCFLVPFLQLSKIVSTASAGTPWPSSRLLTPRLKASVNFSPWDDSPGCVEGSTCPDVVAT